MEECCFCKEVINKDEHVIIFEDDIMLFVCPWCYERESDTGDMY